MVSKLFFYNFIVFVISVLPVAPNGCPFDIKPPDGFTTYFPPYVLSPQSIKSPAYLWKYGIIYTPVTE